VIISNQHSVNGRRYFSLNVDRGSLSILGTPPVVLIFEYLSISFNYYQILLNEINQNFSDRVRNRTITCKQEFAVSNNSSKGLNKRCGIWLGKVGMALQEVKTMSDVCHSNVEASLPRAT
jgi:hypothetical protein